MRIAAVKIDYLNKTFPYDASEIEANPGDKVIIETEFGLDSGVIAEEICESDVFDGKAALKKIIRVALPEDIAQIETLTEKEETALSVCHEEVESANLNMKLVSARYSFDGAKVTFCYTAESRVDFRQLVKSLATRLRTRIELRQVGVRDEARLFGGIGPCGRELCCATFLSSFAPVSIRMAKEQGLPLNPLKISGICGRLFCCLKYEFDYYQEARRKMPKQNDIYVHEGKKYRVININVLKNMIFAEDEEGTKSEIVVPIVFDEPAFGKGCGKCCGKDGHGDQKHENEGVYHDDDSVPPED